MQKATFFKYQGSGNDFILIADPQAVFPENQERLIARLCHRKWGIGADGLILLRWTAGGYPWMRYYNADGGLATMCGNGGRCFAHFAWKQGYVSSNKLTFWAADGWHTAQLAADGEVELSMQPVQHIQSDDKGFIVNTGSPHYLIFDDPETIAQRNILETAKAIRYQPEYEPNGINVNFVGVQNDKTLFVRTYERGVEDETYSCGTGVVAAALTHAYLQHFDQGPIQVVTKGGTLAVNFRVEKFDQFRVISIKLKGPANQVFAGQISLPEIF